MKARAMMCATIPPALMTTARTTTMPAGIRTRRAT
jgi:hypothetical protein